MDEDEIKEFQKSQAVRELDLFFVAPILVYAGMQKKLPDIARYAITGIGIATWIYNYNNYIKNKQLIESQTI